MHKYPQNQSYAGSSGQTLITNVSMTLCNWQIRHQTHVLCGCTTFGTESNQVPNEYGPYARCGLDKGVAYTRRERGGGVSFRLHPLCDIPSGCSFFTGPWTVTRSSLRMLRRVAAFCRPLRPVLLLVSFPRSRSPVVGVLGLR